ncbi:zinc ribbon domain-containing protein [uncultured Lactobacillus sp.]|uniref:zinc ribbon domain-containing protein n=1 Tax=uncultured Lactobacillus sp. TaxID=153152 RepID=UPI002613CA12|nr:zinc ribbon domain-containing protein [uncultured Lactobacillus sp.]
MKTCPNCGAQMEADVNFCTECGSDIRNVAPNQNSQTADIQQVEQPTQTNWQESNNNMNQVIDNSYQQPQVQQVTNNSTTPNQTLSRVSEAVKNFDKDSLWNWFVTSWKTPSAKQNGEKWYGIATLLLEMIIFSWAFGAGVKKAVMSNIPTAIPSYYQDKFNGFFRSLGFDQFLVVLITGAGVIVGSYVAHKIVYNQNSSIWSLINKIVQLSNINAIVVLVLSLICWLSFKSMPQVIIGLMLFVAILYLMAGAFSIHEDQESIRDPFYGVILYLVIVVLFAALAYLVVKGQLVSQIRDTFQVDISQYFNLNNIHF